MEKCGENLGYCTSSQNNSWSSKDRRPRHQWDS